jgi:transposase-like protein
MKGDKTLAEVSRELDIQPSVIREWKRRVEAGATTALATNEDVIPPALCERRSNGFESSSGCSDGSRWR